MIDSLGDRMKNYYEARSRTSLIRRMPVIIRLDGKAFHTFTKGFKRPFDEALIAVMQGTMLYLCKNIQGCVLGYTQSDEITLVLTDYKTLSTDAWFDYEVQKLCSVTASMATLEFNRLFNLIDFEACYEDDEELVVAHNTAKERGAIFDARCFNVPKEEVTNCIYWRQQDATRNSIQMVGQKYFSHKRLHKVSTNQMQNLLLTEHNVNWNDYPTYCKRGSCCIQDLDGSWIIDREIPIFKDEGREYIEKFIDYELNL